MLASMLKWQPVVLSWKSLMWKFVRQMGLPLFSLSKSLISGDLLHVLPAKFLATLLTHVPSLLPLTLQRVWYFPRFLFRQRDR